MVGVIGDLEHVDGDLDIHVAAPALAALGVGVFPRRLGHQGEAVVVQPVHQGPDRRVVLILDQGGIVVGSDQDAALAEFLEQPLVVDVKAQTLGRRIEVRPVDEQGKTIRRVEGH